MERGLILDGALDKVRKANEGHIMKSLEYHCKVLRLYSGGTGGPWKILNRRAAWSVLCSEAHEDLEVWVGLMRTRVEKGKSVS